jgi:hypothetical protein
MQQMGMQRACSGWDAAGMQWMGCSRYAADRVQQVCSEWDAAGMQRLEMQQACSGWDAADGNAAGMCLMRLM